MSPITAPVQNEPSVATVTAIAQGPTTSRTSPRPQDQPRLPSHGARRSLIQRAAMVRAATIGPIGPFNSIDRARPSQNSTRVPR